MIRKTLAAAVAVAALALTGCAGTQSGHGTVQWTDAAGKVSNWTVSGTGTIAPAAAPTSQPPAPVPTPTPTPTPTVAPPVVLSNETVIKTAYTTGYGWWDNTPAGSSAISNPVLHKTAGGTGTYADPVTVAVGHSLATGKDVLDYPQGTRMYVPNLRKYFIVEDTCGDGSTPQNGPCHNVKGSAPGVTVWFDFWVGGAKSTHTQSNNCESAMTDGNGPLHAVILNPASTYAVVPGDIVSGATCHANYGNQAVTQ